MTNDRIVLFATNGKAYTLKADVIPRGRGVQLMKLNDADLLDAKVFTLKEGLSWLYGSGVRVETDLRAWRGERAAAGKSHPSGFPRSRRFGV
jgi:topoisomerase-4 subunit A